MEGGADMSMYSMEEICDGCQYAAWHSCHHCFNSERHFCRCMINHELDVSHLFKICEFKVDNKYKGGNDV